MIDLTIKTLDSRNHTFSVPDDITVKQLKEQIADSVNVTANSQRLIYCGRVLQDDKNLAEYDVNGKVIHLVQRPPPISHGGGNDGGANRNTSQSHTRGTGANPRSHRRLFQPPTGRLDGGNAMYLGAMAFPTDLMESQGLTMPQPRQCLSQSRLAVARQMLRRASGTLHRLEHPTSQGSQQDSPPETSPDGSGNGDVALPGSIAVAAQVATAAAMAAAVSAAQGTSVHIPNVAEGVTISRTSVPMDRNDGAANEATGGEEEVGGEEAASVSSTSRDRASATESSAAASTTAAEDRQPSGQETPAGSEESQPQSENGNGGRSRYPRTTAMAQLLDSLTDVNQRLLPFLERFHQTMRDDPVLEAPEETQRVFVQVSEVMHSLSHAYHALSDIMCDFSQPPPRYLRCRPVLIQHSAVVQTGIPIQAQINVTTNPLSQSQSQSQQNASSNTGNRDSESTTAATTTTEETRASAPATGSGTGTTTATNTTQSGQQTTGGPQFASRLLRFPMGVPGSNLSGAENNSQQENRQGQSTQGTTRPSLNLGPGNFEFFMDVGPGAITIDSLEATVVTNANTSTSEVSVMGGFPWGSPPPAEFIQNLMHALAGQMMEGVANRQGAATTGTGTPTTTTGTTASTTSSGTTTSTTGTQSSPQNATTANSQARGNTATHPTTSTQTRSTARPHVHLTPAVQGLGASSFDPFLPCNSHHIRSTRRRASHQPQNASVSSQASQSSGQQQQSAQQNSGSSETTGPQPQAGTGTRPHFRDATELITLGATAQSLPHLVPFLPSLANFTSTARDVGTDSLQQMPLPAGFPMTVLSQLISGMFGSATQPSSTLAAFIQTLPDFTYTEGESLFVDVFMTLAQSLTFVDIMNLGFGNHECLIRVRPQLRQFVSQRLLQNEPLSQTTASRATDLINQELRPHLDIVQQETNLREDIDLIATISQLNHRQLPTILLAIMEGDNQLFQQVLLYECYNYVRHLCAIIQYCCIDGVQGMENIIRGFVRQMTTGVPEQMQAWTVSSTIVNLRNYLSGMNSMNDDIQPYIVYRRPDVQHSLADQAIPPPAEPMDMEPAAPTRNEEAAAVTSTQATQASSPQPTNRPVIPVEVSDVPISESIPEVLIGSEDWHTNLPSDWVPIITRDSQRQRRQNSQPPFSDAYLSGMPSKRRKLITAAKPQGSLSHVIAENMQTAVGTAGVVSPGVEVGVVAESAGADTTLRLAYRDEVRASVRQNLHSHPDYTPEKYPNAAKYFDAK